MVSIQRLSSMLYIPPALLGLCFTTRLENKTLNQCMTGSFYTIAIFIIFISIFTHKSIHATYSSTAHKWSSKNEKCSRYSVYVQV